MVNNLASVIEIITILKKINVRVLTKLLRKFDVNYSKIVYVIMVQLNLKQKK